MFEKFVKDEGFVATATGWKRGKFEIRKKEDRYFLDLKQRTIASSVNFDEIAVKYLTLKRSPV